LDREFLGEFVRYRVTAKGFELVVDKSHQPGNELFAAGQNVTLGIAENALRLVS
jgi:hypothetical protein